MYRMTGLGRAALVLAVATLLVGALPSRTSAAVRGNAYTSDTYGFSLRWDPSVWSGEEADLDNGAEGVRLDAPASYGMIMAIPADNADPDACLAYLESSWGDDNDSITGFGPASRRTPEPASPIGGVHGVYDGYIQVEDDETDLNFYLECLPILDGDAALTISLIASTTAYVEELPLWEDLLSSVEIEDAGSTGTAAERGRASAAGGQEVYDDEAGFSVAYDGEVWTGTPLAADGDSGIELDNGTTLVYVRTVAADDDIEYCPQDIALRFQQGDTFGRFRKAPAAMERPATFGAAVAGLWTANVSDSVNKYVFYVECRPLDDGVFLTVIAITDNAAYADELPAIQALIDGVSVAADGPARPDDKGRQGRTDDEDAPVGDDSAAKGVAAIEGAAVPFRLTYDGSIWNATDLSIDEFDMYVLVSDGPYAFVMGVPGDDDLRGCVRDEIATEDGASVDGATGAEDALPLPDDAAEAETALVTLTGNTDAGPVQQVTYISCRPAGDGFVSFTFTSALADYEQNLPLLNELLASIVIA